MIIFPLNDELAESLLLTMSYTIEDLELARDELKRWNDAFANDSSNNPDKFFAQRRDAAEKVRRIEQALKDQGLVPKSEAELLNEKLDSLHPNAKSRTVVTHEGKRYQIRYFPLSTSRSRKSVREWGHEWVKVD